MDQYLLFAVLGLGGGGVFAALAVALVATYRGSGTINFATGGTALYGAYTYANLRQGRLFIPVPGLTDNVSLGDPVPTWAAIAVSVGLTGVLGLLQFVLVFRHLRDAAPLARAAASIGVAVLVQGSLAMQAGTNAVPVGPIFPQSSIEIGGSPIPVDRLWLTGCLAALCIALASLYRFTKFGHATEAVAESPVGATLTGLSPDAIGATNWVISSMVAGLGGVLIAPIVPIVPLAYLGFIVAGLAAALAARFRSVGIALVCGLLIGVFQAELTFLATRHSWLPRSGMSEAVSLVLVLGVLLLRGESLPGRVGMQQRHTGLAPQPRRPFLATGLAAPVAAIVVIVTEGSYRAGLITSLIFAVLALSFVVITGYIGQASLAQLALAGVGAFVTSGMTTSWGVPFPLAVIGSGLVAAVIGVVVGLPALRLRGLSVAVATLALAATLEGAWFRNPELNGGLAGARVANPQMFGVDLGVGIGATFPRVEFGLVCVLVLALAGLGVACLRRSRLGFAMLAVRANERSASASGVNVAATKVIAFGIAAGLAGMSGSMLAYMRTSVSADSYSTFVGLVFLATVFLAGVNSITGALIAGGLTAGGIVFVLVDRSFDLGPWFNIIAGIGLVASVAFEPEGISGLVQRIGHRGRSAARPAAAVRPATQTETDETRQLGDVVLKATDLSVAYGGVVAVDHVEVEVRAGQIVGIVGPNGAGKSSLLDAISGLCVSSGTIQLHERTISTLKPDARARLGLTRTFQSLDLYDDLSVRDNVRTGTLRGGVRATWADAATDEIISALSLDDVADVRTADLSQGERQLASIARAAVGAPAAILLDEPAAGLDTSESEWLAARIKDLAATGAAVVLVEHDMTLVRAICDEVYVLEFGKLIAHGEPDVVYADEAVLAAYLGAVPAAEVTT